MRRLPAGLACFAVLCALGGCAAPAGDRGAVTGTSVGATTTGPPGSRAAASTAKQRGAHLSGKQIDLAVYYLRTVGGRRYLVPEWHPVPHTRAVAGAAVGELLGGRPLFPGSRRPFPQGVRLLGVDLEEGTATVDLSGEAFRGWDGPARRWPLQALVHTVTQFPTVKRVAVRVEGRPLGRPLVRDPAVPLAPIALAEPVPEAVVKGDRLVVTGEAGVYEATVSLRLRDDAGRVMAQGYATAATGAPGRGPFSGALSFTPPASPHGWTLEAFEVNPENGEVGYSVKLKVWVGR
jgi:germination protein M